MAPDSGDIGFASARNSRFCRSASALRLAVTDRRWEVARWLRALRVVLPYALPVALGLAVYVTIIGKQLAFNTDSIFYWSAARTLVLDGRLSTGIAYSERDEPSFRPVVGEVTTFPRLYPLTVFAPGYPVAVAIVATCLGQSIALAALQVNLASAVAIISLTVSFGRRIGGAPGGWLAGTLIAVLPFFQDTIAIAASEPLFTALILVALLFLTRWLEHPDGSAFNLFSAGCFGAAATYTRYIGVSFGLLLAVVVVRHSLRHGRSTCGWHLCPIVALGAHLALIAPLFVRNLILTGHIGGAERPASDTGFIANLADTGKGLFHAFPLLRTLISGPADLLASGLVLTIATAGSIVFTYRIGALWSRHRPWPLTSGVLVSFTGAYCVLLLILRSRVGFEVIDVRLLFPALVCLTVVAFATLGWRLAPGPRLVMAAVWLVVSLTATMHASFDPNAGWLNADRERNQPLIRWAEQYFGSQTGRQTLVFADDIYALHFATGRPLLRLPPVSNLDAINSARSFTDLLFIVGPLGPRSSLESWAEQETYKRALSKSAVRVLNGEGYSVWCVPGFSAARSGAALGAC